MTKEFVVQHCSGFIQIFVHLTWDSVLLLWLDLKLVHYSTSSAIFYQKQSNFMCKILPFSSFFSFVTCESVYVTNDSQ